MKTLEDRLLLGAGILYSLLYLVFWPTSYSTLDEAAYFGNAYVMRSGKIFSDVAGVYVPTNFPAGEHLVSKYPLGMSALIALLSFLGWKVALGINLFIHLLTYLVTIQILRLLGVPGLFALLYLLNPTAMLYSRTGMSDLASGLTIALGFYSYLRRQYGLCGFWIGVSLLFRTGNIVALPAFGLMALLEKQAREGTMSAVGEGFTQRLISALQIGVGAIPGFAAATYYALVIAQGKMGKYTGSFGLGYFGEMFPAFALMLLLIYPGMLLAPLLYRGRGKGIIVALCYGFVLLYSFWFYRDQGSSFAESLVMGQRYMLAVMPLFIVAYSETLWRYGGRWLGQPRIGMAAGAMTAVILFAVAGKVHSAHGRFLGTMSAVRDGVLAATTPDDQIYCTMTVAKLLHPGWGKREVHLANSRDREQPVRLAALVEHPAGKGRAVVAFWTRPGRSSDEKEKSALTELIQNYSLRRIEAPVPGDVVLGYLVPEPSRLNQPPANTGQEPTKNSFPDTNQELSSETSGTDTVKGPQ